MRTEFLVLVVAATALLPRVRAEVELLRIEGVREFKEATEPGAVQYACGSAADLARFFAERDLAFDPQLLGPRRGRESCHVFYEPTLPGFRAATEDRPITKLLANIDAQVLVLGALSAGDSVGVVEAVLRRLQRTIPLEVRINQHYDSAYWPKALSGRYGERASWITSRGTPGVDTHPWAQDFVKSGSVDGKLRVLVPRRLFEGREEDGELHRPMLEGFDGEPYVRSKLSWEGGDLLFVRTPREPDKTLMVYGGAQAEYWGRDLPAGECEWVLKTEFGADEALGVVDAMAHVDFVAAFLPDRPTALVAQPIYGDPAIARSIVGALGDFWGASAPKAFQALRMEIERLAGSESADTGEAKRLIEEVRQIAPSVAAPLDSHLARDMDSYVAQHCPDKPESCFDNLEANRKMLETNPDLARRAADLGISNELFERLPLQLLDLVEAQLPGVQQQRPAVFDRVARALEKRGFRIVRTPHLFGADEGTEWPGVGYTNMLAVDRQLFIPTFGLGPAENGLLRRLGKKIGADYEIVPVPARLALLDNGGVHCVFGPVREPETRSGTPPRRTTSMDD